MQISKINTYKSIFLFLLLSFSFSCFSQKELKGVVYDEKTKEPLESVVVYLDGTTSGTVTNQQGKFLLELGVTSDKQVIITYLGYQTITIPLSSISERDYLRVYLKEKLESLNPVYLETDDWSREKKLGYFRKYFIGEPKFQRKCIIENEEDIHLYYSAKDKILYASSLAPLRIKNSLLGYDILYNLVDFEIRLNNYSLVNSVYFLGTSFFSEFPNNSNYYKRKRLKAYEGSVLHFMRSLATNNLENNDFEIFYKGFKVSPDQYFVVTFKERTAEVLMTAERLSILFKKKQTELISNTKEPFYIDGLGNHTSPDKLLFSGYMGSLKVSQMLPINYGL
ncbi:carboxypeptidase-like regulatory domain-containing protein [Aquimarina sp. 2201CG5-10]|uniref:carboxypeptidase-like regulatory domain-containing protein n=1 Tax=Aquimarina callyspongiae TaxID=3098150 RepID=UPI002AB5B0DA|nr:carboxypeptidase-like regulatory domain-containing protein [Aquimarina sp. 2201CG5-10]MDY8136961.1 carboxypeptidase-like regulatory domain-containing protein [Aquimarina sp. 2201CG5-10]